MEAFKQVGAPLVADFCLEMYRRMGLLEGIEVIRSSDPAVRRADCPIGDHFVDVPHHGEIVRARCINGALQQLLLPLCTLGSGLFEQREASGGLGLRWR